MKPCLQKFNLQNLNLQNFNLQEGKDYYFTDRTKFERGIGAGQFLEHAEVHGNLYGTTYQAVENVGRSGRCCVLDIDVQGARLVCTKASLHIFTKQSNYTISTSWSYMSSLHKHSSSLHAQCL